MSQEIDITNIAAGLRNICLDIQQKGIDADYSNALDEFLPVIAQQEAGMFAGGFDSNLSDWPSLSASTIRRKGHDRILVETGGLRESLVSVGGPGNISATAERGLVFGTDVWYAGFPLDGTCTMPARPPVGLTEDTVDRLVDSIATTLIEQLT